MLDKNLIIIRADYKCHAINGGQSFIFIGVIDQNEYDNNILDNSNRDRLLHVIGVHLIRNVGFTKSDLWKVKDCSITWTVNSVREASKWEKVLLLKSYKTRGLSVNLIKKML